MARSLPVQNLLPQNVGQLSTTCSNVLKQPNGELLVAVNHNQLRTMASETVDPIDWSYPPPSWAVPPERLLVHSINQCTQLDSNVQPQHARQPPCLCGHSGKVSYSSGLNLITIRLWLRSDSDYDQTLITIRLWLRSDSDYDQTLITIRLWLRFCSDLILDCIGTFTWTYWYRL